jgi:hypothetical protein
VSWIDVSIALAVIALTSTVNGTLKQNSREREKDGRNTLKLSRDEREVLACGNCQRLGRPCTWHRKKGQKKVIVTREGLLEV